MHDLPVLELHTWGPAFCLPSIDPECLSTIIYLKGALPPTDWVLIPSSDPSANPTGELPALRANTHQDKPWVCGFKAIVEFLRRNGIADLDQDLNDTQRAHTTSWSSFVVSRGLPLLDLYMFVSTDNYVEWTRPAFAHILQWPQQWLVPPVLQDRAKARTEHMGLSSLDIQMPRDEGSRNALGAVWGSLPTVLTDNTETLTSVLGRKGHRMQFRLDAITNEFFSQLDTLLPADGQPCWMHKTPKATTLDCLLLGYLMIMSGPSAPPHKWLHTALAKRWRGLGLWAATHRKNLFGSSLDVSEVLAMQPSDQVDKHLPWYPRPTYSPMDRGVKLLSALKDSMPFVSFLSPAAQAQGRQVQYEDELEVDKDAVTEDRKLSADSAHTYSRIGLPLAALGAFSGICVSGGYLYSTASSRQSDRPHGEHVFSTSKSARDSGAYGESGDILGIRQRG